MRNTLIRSIALVTILAVALAGGMISAGCSDSDSDPSGTTGDTDIVFFGSLPSEEGCGCGSA